MPLDTNHIWQEHCGYYPSLPGVTNVFQVKVIKDSVINGKIYKYMKVYGSTCSTFPNTYAFLRQDTILKRIIIFRNNQDNILYNFNKNVGDTAKLFCLVSGVLTYTCGHKDSVLLSDGFYHKRFNFNGNIPGDIIEGVGSTRGLIWPYCITFDSNMSLQCLAQITPSQTIYSSGGIGTNCPMITGINNSLSDYKIFISIFPNPTSDNLNIKTTTTVPNSIEIKNVLGQTIFFTNNILQDITTVNVKDFSQGIYFITVDLGDKNVTGHFIKN